MAFRTGRISYAFASRAPRRVIVSMSPAQLKSRVESSRLYREPVHANWIAIMERYAARETPAQYFEIDGSDESAFLRRQKQLQDIFSSDLFLNVMTAQGANDKLEAFIDHLDALDKHFAPLGRNQKAIPEDETDRGNFDIEEGFGTKNDVSNLRGIGLDDFQVGGSPTDVPLGACHTGLSGAEGFWKSFGRQKFDFDPIGGAYIHLGDKPSDLRRFRQVGACSTGLYDLFSGEKTDDVPVGGTPVDMPSGEVIGSPSKSELSDLFKRMAAFSSKNNSEKK